MSLMRLEEPVNSPVSPPCQSPIVAGIDFGTTQSLVAAYESGKAVILNDEDGRGALPSIVHVSANGVKVGWDALELLGHAPDRTFFSVKRWLGLDPQQAEILSANLPYQPMFSEEGYTAFQVEGINGDIQLIHPVELAAKIFAILKRRAENYFRAPLDGVVVTVPAYFNDSQRKSVKDAATLSGLKVLRLLSEPTAAALAYCQVPDVQALNSGYLAVYDFGGGTFDFSLIKKSGLWLEVVATAGNALLGGDDIDAAIAEQVQAAWQKNYANVLLGEEERKRQWQQWLFLSRQAKEALSFLDHTQLNYGRWEIIITRETVERLMEPLIRRTLEIVQDVLVEKAISVESISRFFFVGGSTKIPYLRKTVETFLGRSFVSDLDPELVVAQGAAYHAHELARLKKPEQPAAYTLLDVTPFSLGLETLDRKVEVFLPRNTPLPAAVTQIFTNAAANQTTLPFRVLQGQSNEADACQVLAEFSLNNLPEKPAGELRIAVQFSVDNNGILTVRAQDESTHIFREIQVQPAYALPDDLRQQLLAREIAAGAETESKNNAAESLMLQAGQLIEWLETHPLWKKLLKQDSQNGESCLQWNWDALQQAYRHGAHDRLSTILAWFESQNLPQQMRTISE